MIRTLRRMVGRRLLNAYKRRKQRASDLTLDHCLDAARAILSGAKCCFLISHGEEGWCSARLVAPISDLDHFTVWIGTNPGLRKVREIRTNPKVTLAFARASEDANLVLYGEARIETDLSLRKRHWKGEWRLFFPNGPAGDDYVLLRIEFSRMELMDFRRNVIPEPFGLRPAILEKKNGTWSVRE